MPFLLPAQCRRRLCQSSVPLVQDEVPGLHGHCDGKLHRGILLLHLPHFAHALPGMDITDDTEDDPVGSHMVGCTSHHSSQRRSLLVDDDLGVICLPG